MSRPKEDVCNTCERYAMGCDPLVLADGTRLRQLQRDKTKRFCRYHMPALNERLAEMGKRRQAGLPPLPKVEPTCTLPRIPLGAIVRDSLHLTTPTITRVQTPAQFIEEATRATPTMSRIIDVRWSLKTPAETFYREGNMFHAAVIVGFRVADAAPVRAVKFRRSRECDAIWLWRDEGRDTVFEKWANRMPHVNALVWQWGLDEVLLLQKERAA
jgi:hypothetical protein